MDLDCLDEGIPDKAFNAVTGDDKQLSVLFKKQNKQQRDKQNQLSVWNWRVIAQTMAKVGESWEKLLKLRPGK